MKRKKLTREDLAKIARKDESLVMYEIRVSPSMSRLLQQEAHLKGKTVEDLILTGIEHLFGWPIRVR
ncbi:MAG: hypothetical protein QOF14_3730 [Hyphomicrobiales bacterium]|nr:hypothetical protein [Hyphomicrobiales bacterium]